MPKVSPEYFEEKRQIIVDATMEVCKRKTLSSITLQDIINESGLSQGGIYHFYSNIDDILTELLNRVRSAPPVDDLAAVIFDKYREKMKLAQAAGNAPEHLAEQREIIREVIVEISELMANSMKKYLFPYYKIEFEYNILITNYPKRAKSIYSAVKYPNLFDRTVRSLAQEFAREAQDGVIVPQVSIQEFFEYNSVVYDGILKRALARGCYERNIKNNTDYEYDIAARFRTLGLTNCNLLGI